MFKNLHQCHFWTKLSYINFPLLPPAFHFNNTFPPFISYCLVLKWLHSFCNFLHSSQILLILASILFFFSESIVTSDARIYQGDQRNDHAGAALSLTVRITLSKCPCWTFVLKPPPTGIGKAQHLSLSSTWPQTINRISKGRKLNL